MADAGRRSSHLPGCCLTSLHVVPFDCEIANDDLKPIALRRHSGVCGVLDDICRCPNASDQDRRCSACGWGLHGDICGHCNQPATSDQQPSRCGVPWDQHPSANGEPYCERSSCPATDHSDQHSQGASRG